jgi:MFS family permease
MVTSTRVPGVRRLAATLYGYSFLDDLVLLYPLYALLFADTGLSAWHISSLFVIWAGTGIVLEVPFGALADALSRRLLLCVGPLLSAVAFAVWVLAPSYWVFALGFVLWGMKGALQSGSLEALVYEELDRVGAADAYAGILGRAEAVAMVAVLAGSVAAAPVVAAWGYGGVGAASVAACLAAAAVATRFPEHRGGPARVDDEPDLGYVAALRAGLAEVRSDPVVRRAVLLVPAVSAVWGSLEEYTPLLVRDTGVGTATVPLLLVLITAGQAGGGLLAGPARRLGLGRFAALLVLAAVALAVGAGSGVPAGIVLVAAAFGAFQVATVVADTRLQARITGPSRATVTSVASLATDLGTVGVYGLYATLAAAGHGGAFAAFSAVYLGVAAWLLYQRRHPAPVPVPVPAANDES